MATAPSTTAEVPEAGAPSAAPPAAVGCCRNSWWPRWSGWSSPWNAPWPTSACRRPASRPRWPAARLKPAEARPRQETAGAEADEAPADVEVDLGEFCVTALQPTASMTLRIDFHLYGSVAAENEKEFKRLLEDNKHRLREQVLVTIRSADISDLTDASLGLIKRLILEQARKTLGKPLLREVIISDYSFIEQ